MGEDITLTWDLDRERSGLEAACAAGLGGLTFADLEAGLVDGRYIALDIRGQGMAVLALERPVVIVVALAGRQMADWLADLYAAVRRLAAEQGCTRIRSHGRRGWEKALRPLGFEVASVTMEGGV